MAGIAALFLPSLKIRHHLSQAVMVLLSVSVSILPDFSDDFVLIHCIIPRVATPEEYRFLGMNKPLFHISSE
jgi:hypothetical protein